MVGLRFEVWHRSRVDNFRKRRCLEVLFPRLFLNVTFPRVLLDALQTVLLLSVVINVRVEEVVCLFANL